MRYSLATLKGKKDLIGAEIGVAHGKNALEILQNLDIKKLYLIDPYIRYSNIKYIGIPSDVDKLQVIAYNMLKAYTDKIVWIHEMSIVASAYIKDVLDFVYIDANHTYEYAKSDILIYRDLVKDGGLIAGHDYGAEVKTAVDELVQKDKLIVKRPDWWYIQ